MTSPATMVEKVRKIIVIHKIENESKYQTDSFMFEEEKNIPAIRIIPKIVIGIIRKLAKECILFFDIHHRS